MFDKSSNFNIYGGKFIDASGATCNHVHGAQSGASDNNYHQIIV